MAAAAIIQCNMSSTSSLLTNKRGWKEDLRQSCLIQARKKRRTSALHVVEHELGHYRVQVASAVNTPDRPSSSSQQQNNVDNEEDYLISEDEWIELLEEVENEIERSNVEQHALEQERYEELHTHLEEQIADYELWSNREEEEGVVCPVCNNADLIQNHSGEVVCPCGLCAVNLGKKRLDSLRQTLQRAYEDHSIYCGGPLTFRVASASDGETCIEAVCSECHAVNIL
jgi:hypothetical protein